MRSFFVPNGTIGGLTGLPFKFEVFPSGYVRTDDPAQIDRILRIPGVTEEGGNERVAAVREAPKSEKPKERTAIVQLGRMGDIINILPLAKYLRDRDGSNPTVVVHQDYKTILDGCSYVDPVIWRGALDDPLSAEKEAAKTHNVLVAQVFGRGVQFDRQCDSFTKEQWRRMGFLPLFGTVTRVEFDKRNLDREQALVRNVIGKDKRPVILVNLSGQSSPYQFASQMLEDIQFRWGRLCNVIDLSKVRAERIYDLIGLYGKSILLITSDTSTMHLASASNIPFVALRVDTPTLWHGAITHRQPNLVLRYKESLDRREELHREIDYLVARGHTDRRNHVFLDFKASGDTARRNALARETWLTTYDADWYQVPVLDEQLPRLFRDGNKSLPFIKDVIDFGLARHHEILLTNTDTCFAPEIEAKLKGIKVGYGSRRDFKKLDKALTQKQVEAGKHYPGSDIFSITRTWWSAHRAEMPDMIFGAEGWDCCLRVLMQETGGKEIKNAIYHERHASRWEVAQNRFSLPSQVHCRDVAVKFLKARGIDPKPHGL